MAILAETGAARQEAQHCLAQMEALAHEIRTAIDAVAGNALPVLEDSVERQRELANGLGVAVSRVRAAGLGRQGTSLQQDFESRFRKGLQALSTLNEEYAVLLEHSGRSVRLLQALHGKEAGPNNRSARFGNGLLRPQISSWEG